MKIVYRSLIFIGLLITCLSPVNANEDAKEFCKALKNYLPKSGLSSHQRDHVLKLADTQPENVHIYFNNIEFPTQLEDNLIQDPKVISGLFDKTYDSIAESNPTDFGLIRNAAVRKKYSSQLKEGNSLIFGIYLLSLASDAEDKKFPSSPLN